MIEIQRASNLGPLHKTLGIESGSRVAICRRDPSGQIEIWDLGSQRYFTIGSMFTSSPTVIGTSKETPQWLQAIINTPSDQLLAEFHSSWEEGAGDRRMTVFAELCYRGVDTLSRQS